MQTTALMVMEAMHWLVVMRACTCLTCRCVVVRTSVCSSKADSFSITLPASSRDMVRMQAPAHVMHMYDLMPKVGASAPVAADIMTVSDDGHMCWQW